MSNNTDNTDPIASSRYEIVCVLAITGWIAAFFLLGILIGASK